MLEEMGIDTGVRLDQLSAAFHAKHHAPNRRVASLLAL
jgi:hypothetical protein